MLKIGGKTDSSLKAACAVADKNLSSLGQTAKTAGKVVAGAAIAAAAAVGTLGVAAIKAGAEYETQLANISTLLSGTEAQVAARTSEIGEQILDVSNRTGVATANLTDGMYQVISAFGDSADAASVLETAAKAAAAGNATTTDSINLLAAVTKGYGDQSAAAVQKAADLSFATVRLGQTTFPELAASMSGVIPIMSQMGVSQEQLFGAMATLTGVTGGTAEVATQLESAMAIFSQADAMQAIKSWERSGRRFVKQGFRRAAGPKGAWEDMNCLSAVLFSEAQTAVLPGGAERNQR
jgi:TP901 family phage tail tape measure protein